MKIEYAGGKFCGSQLQPGVRTVQAELERALGTFFRTRANRAIKVHFSGRTDTGVHAIGQVVHFELTDEFLSRGFGANTPPAIDESILTRMTWALNGILAQDVSIKCAQLVPHHFNARFSAIRRTYVYSILNRPQRSALRHTTQYFVPAVLNLESMKTAANCLLGLNDFAAFKSSNSDRVSSICNVDRAEILNKREGELEFWISANHFVYNMVRIIVGTLVEVGLGKRDPLALSEALTGKDRHLAGPTAPPWGLCLHSVDYPAEFNLFQEEVATARFSLSSQEKES